MHAKTTFGPDDRVSEGKLWFGVLAGPVAWALHGFTSFQIATTACADGGGGVVRISLAILTLVLIAVALAGAVVSYSGWRVLSERRTLLQAEGLGRPDFMSLIGIFASSAFLLGIIWAGLPLILLDVCNKAR